MVVAGLLPWLLGPRIGVVWLVASNLAVLPVYIQPLGFPPFIAVLQAVGYMGFSSFVFVIALVARRQAEARDEQRRLNSELRATRALLAESARVNERTRISRELHDLLGHQLTALTLNLEVAGHLADGQALEHVKRSHALAKLLLGNVREVVRQLRETGAIDLAAALRPLTENVPSLDIQLEIEDPLNVDDPQRAHVLLRCTQEIITNAVRHAGARHLWIKVYREAPDRVVVEARDDGVGAEMVNVGNGLRGMRERLQQCGGQLQVETRPGEGFRLRATVPATVLVAALTKVPEGGSRSLLALDDGIEVVAEAGDGRQAVELIPQMRPDVVLMDMRMPVMSGLEALQVLSRQEQLPPTIILTTFDDDQLVLAGLKAGAKGYLLKDATLAQRVGAIRTVADGAWTGPTR
ncbi:hypothetical protein G6F22_012920 [Rhizopus arrhizus]|nr:hypothetical protein G6F22_012920 [Rhizopus arrhizus]